MKKIVAIAMMMAFVGMLSAQIIPNEEINRRAQEEINRVSQLEHNIQTPQPSIGAAKVFEESIKFAEQIQALDNWQNQKRKRFSLPEQDFVGWSSSLSLSRRQQYNISPEEPNYLTKLNVLQMFRENAEGLFISARIGEIMYRDSIMNMDGHKNMKLFWRNNGTSYTMKIFANTVDLPPIIFVAYANRMLQKDSLAKSTGRLQIHYNNIGEDINLKNNVVITRTGATNGISHDPYGGKPITILSSDGEKILGLESACGYTLFLNTCAQIAFNDTLKHGDVYFCMVEDKSHMASPSFLSKLASSISGGHESIIVLLDGVAYNQYATNSTNVVEISSLMAKALEETSLSWNRAPEVDAWKEVPNPVVRLYCGVHDSGTLGEWSSLEELLDVIRLSRSIVANVKMINK